MRTHLPSRPVTFARAVLLGLACGSVALPAAADLALDPSRSSVSLLSMKVLADGTTSVTERHSFADLTGSVNAAGAATVTIALASIRTGVPIRDERMGEVLFDSARHPHATITATVPDEALDGGARRLALPIELALHGRSQPLVVPVAIDGDGSRITVTATEPVLLDAAAHDLDGGIGKLVGLAGLMHIPTTVPVSFSLTFVDTGS